MGENSDVKEKLGRGGEGGDQMFTIHMDWDDKKSQPFCARKSWKRKRKKMGNDHIG